jgi:predicted membrane protein
VSHGAPLSGGKCMAKNNYSLGLILIVLSVVLLLGKLGVIGFLGHLFWPIFVLLPGLLFHILYFSRVLPAGVLVPGGMLVTYSILFFYCNVFGWSSMAYLWPGFIFGVAVGLYELNIFQRSNSRGAFTAAFVLAIISFVFFAIAFLFTVGIYFIAAALIGIGLIMMVKRRKTW